MVKKKIAVIGLGGFGRELVRSLFKMGHEVLAIDRDMDTIDDYAPVSTNAVCLDSTDERAMRSQGLEDMDFVILASADNFEMLVVTADICLRIGVKRLIARYRTSLHIRILKMLGITEIFNPEENAAKNMAEQLVYTGLLRNIILDKAHRMIEVKTPSDLVGVTIAESKLREKYKLNLVTIKQKKKSSASDQTEDIKDKLAMTHVDNLAEDDEEFTETTDIKRRFKKEDILVLFGRHQDIEQFLESYRS